MATTAHRRSVSIEFAASDDRFVWDGKQTPVWLSRSISALASPSYASLEVAIPTLQGTASQLEVTGVFAIDGVESPSPNDCAGSFMLFAASDQVAVSLSRGRHFSDARKNGNVALRPGDGTSLDALGCGELDGSKVRVDKLTFDLPFNPTRIVFSGSPLPIAFAVLKIELILTSSEECPFHSRRGGIALAEIPSLVRLGDRVRFQQALLQLEQALRTARDLDEARGQALTFIAVLTAAALEAGASSALHRVQLDASRELERHSDAHAIADASVRIASEIANPLFVEATAPTDALIDRALSIIDRNFGRQISDDIVAEQLGLSTSHFRFLFRTATGQPFHRFLVSKRLEHGRRLLVEAGLPVGTVANEVGFSSASHFSRAFSKRFGVSPASLRRGSG